MAMADWGLIALLVGIGILAVLMVFEHRDVLKRQGAGEWQWRWPKIKRGDKSGR
jgi:hypothetical protein